MLEKSNDFEELLNNLANFYHWCASRVLSLDRTYAKQIMNSLGVPQAVTDRDRAQISRSYHCVSRNDVYWVRTEGEAVSFKELNLYDHPLNEAIIPLPLKGKHLTVTNKELAPDLSTKGCFPKAWIRKGNVPASACRTEKECKSKLKNNKKIRDASDIVAASLIFCGNLG